MTIEKTEPIKMTAGFVVMSTLSGTQYHPSNVTAEQLVEVASTIPEIFPEGLSLDQARWLLENPNEIVEGK